jgi:hypothetical protein
MTAGEAWLMKWTFAALLLAGLAVPAQAEVVQADAGGFVVSGSVTATRVSRDQAWVALLVPARWWSSAHTWSGDAANLRLANTAGGCFCEAIPDPANGDELGSAEHMRVIQTVPGQLLRLQGALGPLQSEAVIGVLTIEIEDVTVAGLPSRDVETGVLIRWTYVIGGYSRVPLDQIAPAVDAVVAEQMQRLAAHLQALGP